MTNPSLLPTPAEMIAHLDGVVRGQVRAKQDIAVAVYNHFLSQAWRERQGQDLGRHHILLIGPTGVGKTYIVRMLAEFLNVPVGFASAAGLVEAGYKGNSVESVIRSLLDRANGDPRKAEKGIVFIDEIDKIRRGETDGRDVSGEGVQNALLTLLDGRRSEGLEGMAHAAVDTSRLLFICTGAFVGLNDIIRQRIGAGRGRIGFAPRPTENTQRIPDLPLYATLCQVQNTDLVEFGMIPEFIGRFATISILHELAAADLQDIVRGAVSNSPLHLQQQLARIHGIQLELTHDALDAIAAEAAALGTGARGLHRLLGRAVDAVDHRWAELAAEGVCQVVIDQNCALGSHPPTLVKGPPATAPIHHELRREALGGMPRSPKPLLNQNSSQNQQSHISCTAGWTSEQLWNRIVHLKTQKLEWEKTSPAARTWWQQFEDENKHRPALILRLVEELVSRQASVNQFYLAYVYSNTDNIQANLHYLDYLKLKNNSQSPDEQPPDQPAEGP